jgi:hypothetical protein
MSLNLTYLTTGTVTTNGTTGRIPRPLFATHANAERDTFAQLGDIHFSSLETYHPCDLSRRFGSPLGLD